jgi:hypothetical protein
LDHPDPDPACEHAMNVPMIGLSVLSQAGQMDLFCLAEQISTTLLGYEF